MAQGTPKRKIRDSVFTNLFQDRKYLLQLYRTLHPEDDGVSEGDIRDVTIRHILVDADYNDLGFSIGDKLVILVESQSMWTWNIIIRALMYLVQTYHDYFKRTKQNLYGYKKVDLPKPELYLIFTGERPKDPPDIISLSKDFFGGEKIAVDAQIKVLYQENESIVGQYIIFCKVYGEQRKKYGPSKRAITETIRICKDRNVLKEYLESKEKEVVDIMMTLFDEEEIWEIYAEDKAKEIAEKAAKKAAEKAAKKATEEATKEAAQKAAKEAKETAVRLIKKGKLSLEEIADCIPALSLDELKKLEAEILQTV